MLVHRLRRWTNINPALAQRIVFAEIIEIIAAKIEKSARLNY